MSKTQIGSGRCPVCGHVNAVTETKNAGGFLICNNYLEHGACGTRIHFSRHGVAKLFPPKPAPVETADRTPRPEIVAPKGEQQKVKGGSYDRYGI